MDYSLLKKELLARGTTARGQLIPLFCMKVWEFLPIDIAKSLPRSSSSHNPALPTTDVTYIKSLPLILFNQRCSCTSLSTEHTPTSRGLYHCLLYLHVSVPMQPSSQLLHITRSGNLYRIFFFIIHISRNFKKSPSYY